jgi:hypothetical protein
VLINLSAFYGVPIVDMLLRPREAMSTPLLDLWSGFHWLSAPFARNDDRIRAGRWLVKRLLSHQALFHLPSMRILAKDIEISPSRLKAFDPEAYVSYMDAYENQCGPITRYMRGVVFIAARRRLKGMNPNHWRRHSLWRLYRDIERDTRISQDDVYCATSAAIIYSRLLAQAVRHAKRTVEAKEDIRWIESAPTGEQT